MAQSIERSIEELEDEDSDIRKAALVLDTSHLHLAEDFDSRIK